jgi:hypothetical protein
MPGPMTGEPQAHIEGAEGEASVNSDMAGAVCALEEYVPGQVWLGRYPVRYSGIDFDARMSVIRLANGGLMLHSPGPIDSALKRAIEELGRVDHIVAPGSYHYFHVPAAQAAFPEADTFICPGVERKLPQLEFDWLLGDRPPGAWAGELDQVLVRGTRYIWEVAFYHVASRTLLLVDLVENIGDRTDGVGWGLKLWWKGVFRMWNRAKPAPEYQLGWKDKAAASRTLERILAWDFERVVISHGDLIEENAKAVLREAWRSPLG